MREGSDMAQALRDNYLQRIVDMVDEGRGELDNPDSIGRGVAEGVCGSFIGFLMRELQSRGGPRSAEEMIPEMMYIAVRPYLGPKVALEELHVVHHVFGEFAAERFPERAQIRNAAMAEIVEHGFDETTVEMVCERAQVPMQDFERSFTDLRDCCFKVYLANIDEFDRIVFSAVEERWDGAIGCAPRPMRQSVTSSVAPWRRAST